MDASRHNRHNKKKKTSWLTACVFLLLEAAAGLVCFVLTGSDGQAPRGLLFGILTGMVCLVLLFFNLLQTALGQYRKIKQRNKTLAEDLQRLEVAFNQIGCSVFEYDIKTGTIRNISNAICETFGLPRILPGGPREIVRRGHVAAEYARDFLEAFEKMRRGEKKAVVVEGGEDAAGNFIWNRVTLTNRFDSAGKPVKAIGTIDGIGKEKAMEMSYVQEEAYRTSSSSKHLMILTIDLTTTKVISVIRAAQTVASVEDNLFFNEKFRCQLLRDVHPEDKTAADAFYNKDLLLRHYQENGESELDLRYRLLRKPNEYIWVSALIKLLRQPGNGDIVCFCYIRDVHEKTTEELRERYRLEHDPLTGIYNRVTAQTLIDAVLSDQPGMHAFLILDLDNFKAVNDHYGHSEGDALLRAAADSLARCAGPGAITARLGGDEFIVFLSHIPDQEDAVQTADTICRAFEALESGRTGNYGVSASAGIAFSPEHGNDFQTLYEKSDVALYRAKQTGKHQYAVYTTRMEASSVRP